MSIAYYFDCKILLNTLFKRLNKSAKFCWEVPHNIQFHKYALEGNVYNHGCWRKPV